LRDLFARRIKEVGHGCISSLSVVGRKQRIQDSRLGKRPAVGTLDARRSPPPASEGSWALSASGENGGSEGT